MKLQISKIEIRNFRSARNLSISSNSLAILVGKNDSGKSNVLRALNLFFNEQTNPKQPLFFSSDHNVFNNPNRRAKEISVSLNIELPETYQSTNGEYIIWAKKWRHDGLYSSEYKGFRRKKGSRGSTYDEEVRIPERSNVHSLLRNINFVYVPAIKDPAYFSELRASIYSVISEVADIDFRSSSQNFESSISEQLNDLTVKISQSLGLQSKLALPKDLSHIFESLDFLSKAEEISLDSRGDGIKARHIPLILKFMVDRIKSLQGRGAPPQTFIWGYEEPENNLELKSCIELADQFWNFLDEGINQIFLTTHSPIFYNLHRKDDEHSKWISCHHMFRDNDDDGTKEAPHLSDLDDRMGTMALIAPLITKIEDRVRQQKEAEFEAAQLSRQNRRKIFVEGPSDKTIIEKALIVFAPTFAPDIDVETKESAGHNYVADMLLAWRTLAKHDSTLPRAIGIVDQDRDARKMAKKWNEHPGNVKSAKCFKITTPPHIQRALKAGFQVPVVLETLYDKDAWEWADKNGHLKDRDNNVLPLDLLNKIIRNETNLDEKLNSDWAIYVKKEFHQGGKSPMSRHFSKKSNHEFKTRMPFIESMITEIVSYLFQGDARTSEPNTINTKKI